jgi:site-specific DNA recombinase
MRRVVYYERVSSEDQKERETILTQAEDLAKRLDNDPDVTVVDRYIDDGISGALDLKDRPEGRRLLQDAAAGQFDEVWMWKLDRIGRDDIDPLVVRRDLNRLGVKLCALHDNIDGKLEYALRVAIAAEERRTFHLRTEAGMNRAAREGRYCGGIVPLGYRVEGKNPHARLIPSDAPMWNDLTEADVVRSMYEKLAVDGWSCTQLTAELNFLGVPTAYQKDGRGVRGRRTQQIWRPNRVYCLIKNPIYRGELQYGRHSKHPGGRDIISAPVPRLVSDEIWYAAQDSLHRHNLNPEGKRRVYLLRSLMICGLCGMRYAGITSPGREGVYRCGGQLVSRRPELDRKSVV